MATPNHAERIRTSADTFDCAGKAIGVERFEPPGPGPHPALVLLHGADGLPGRSLPYRDLAAQLAEHGYLADLVHYFDVTGGRASGLGHPLQLAAWLSAAGAAVGHAAAAPAADPGRVGLVGVSLGAYLAVAVASQDRRVGAVVECCGGVADFFTRGLERMPPVLILHGGDDPVVPVSEAHRLDRLLTERRRPHEVHIYPGRGHRLSGADFEDAVARTLAFLDRHLKGDAA
jgi:carboxymethylenebutenolidase